MKFQNNIRFKFRIIFITVFLLVTLLLSALLINESLRITKTISRDYAQLYTNEIVGDIHAHLNREIALAIKAAKTRTITNWMRNEQDPANKQLAFEEIIAFNDVLQDNNLFIAIDKSKHFYFVEDAMDLQAFKATGVLNKNIAEDIWYFKTLEAQSTYMLNIDTDRFLKTLRAWINVKVQDGDEILGVVGTGLYLDPFIRDIFEKRRINGVKSVIINEYGAIQMDSNLENIRENSFGPDTETTVGTIYQFFNQETLKPEIDAYLKNATEPIVLELDHESYSYVAFAPIRGTNWHVVTFFDAGTLFVVSNLYPALGMIAVLFIALGIGLSLIIQRVLIKPFEQIHLSLQDAGMTAEHSIYGLERTDELGVLARAIQAMQKQLSDYNKNLESEIEKRSLALASAYQRITENEARLNRLFENIPVGVFTLDANYKFCYENPAFLRQFSCETETEFTAMYQDNFQKLFVEARDYDLIMATLKKNPDAFGMEVQLKSKEKGVFWADIRFNRMDLQNESILYEGLLIDIQVKKDYEMKLLDRANLDRLTGIYNRHYLDSYIQSEIHRSCRYDETMALAVFDLDHFKAVNDTWGHNIGDEVLKNTVHIIQKLIRRSDVLCRWGGEEFVIIMPHTSLKGASVLAEKMRKAMAITAHSDVGIVTASFGVSEYQKDELFEDWFKRADDALFEAKHSGRNRVVVAENREQIVPAFIKLIWKNQFESGNEQIDFEHKQLFELANNLMDYMLSPNSIAQQLHQFDLLAEHIVKHFENEESIMKASDYSDWQAHRQLHQVLIQKVSAYRIKLFNGELRSLEVLNFLINEVIVDHLLAEDAKYFAYLAGESQQA